MGESHLEAIGLLHSRGVRREVDNQLRIVAQVHQQSRVKGRQGQLTAHLGASYGGCDRLRGRQYAVRVLLLSEENADWVGRLRLSQLVELHAQVQAVNTVGLNQG